MEKKIHQINDCEVCESNNLKPVLNLGLHPMCDDLIPIGDNRKCKEYPIEILFCNNCLTAHQKFQVPKEELFPKSYHYRSRFTNDVLIGMENLVKACKNLYGDLNDKIVLDIGCNDGSLLDFFKNQGSKTIGLEPTDASLDAIEKDHIIYPHYLTEEIAHKIILDNGKPDFITFTNVFAHIHDLKGVLNSLKLLMKPKTKLIIENHYLGSVLDGNQFDTFYHEHPRTYSFNSFKYMAKSLGMLIENVQFPSRYGGNIQVFIGSNGDFEDKIELENKEKRFLKLFDKLNLNILKWKGKKSAELKRLNQENGMLHLKAFPGRSAILIKILGLDEKIVSAVYEKPGSLKIGQYVPGTKIPILSDNQLFEDISEIPVLINLAWHIPNEIEKYLRQNNYKGDILNILSVSDFE